MIEVVREMAPPLELAPLDTSTAAVEEAEGEMAVDERGSIGRDVWAASVES